MFLEQSSIFFAVQLVIVIQTTELDEHFFTLIQRIIKSHLKTIRKINNYRKGAVDCVGSNMPVQTQQQILRAINYDLAVAPVR